MRSCTSNYPSKLIEQRTTSTSTYVAVYLSIHPLGGIYVDDLCPPMNLGWVRFWPSWSSGKIGACCVVHTGDIKPIENDVAKCSVNPAALPFWTITPLTCAFLVCTDHRLLIFSPDREVVIGACCVRDSSWITDRSPGHLVVVFFITKLIAPHCMPWFHELVHPCVIVYVVLSAASVRWHITICDKDLTKKVPNLRTKANKLGSSIYRFICLLDIYT
jgi:hypothetical protein